MPLRQVADLPLGRARCRAEDRRPALAQWKLPEQDAQKRGLPRTVRAEHRDELAVGDPKRRILPDRPTAQDDGGIVELDDGRRGYRPVAWWRAAARGRSCATCHCSKLEDAGESVSVTVATGMWCCLQSALIRWMSGVTFWLLNTHTAIRCSCAWRSTV